MSDSSTTHLQVKPTLQISNSSGYLYNPQSIKKRIDRKHVRTKKQIMLLWIGFTQLYETIGFVVTVKQ